MQRLYLVLSAVVLGCLAVPAKLAAEEAKDYFDRGVACQDKGEYDNAILNYSQASRLIDPNDAGHAAKVYNNRGSAFSGNGEYAQAIADFNQSLRLNPICADAHLNRGNALGKIGEFDKTIADYDQALRLFDPKDTENLVKVWCSRGNIWQGKGKYDKAIDDYNQALSPSSRPELQQSRPGPG